MINKYFGGVIPSASEKEDVDDDLIATIENGVKKVAQYFDDFHIADAADEIMTVLRRLNKYIDETTPWILGKDESKKDRLSTVMYNLFEGIRICATMLYPFMPESAQKIIAQINDPENVCVTLGEWADIEKFGKAFAHIHNERLNAINNHLGEILIHCLAGSQIRHQILLIVRIHQRMALLVRVAIQHNHATKIHKLITFPLLYIYIISYFL
jgi:methionyl-tRNA synthetase